MKKKGNGAGGKKDGDYVIDLGEKIDGVVESKVRTAMAGPSKSSVSRPGFYRPGGYRPGMYGQGSYRPWYASQNRGGFDLGKIWPKYPQTLNSNQMLTGAALGILGNRLVARLVPSIIPTTSKLAVDAITFGVGIIPALARPNSMTIGLAVPGLVILGADLADMLLDAVGMAKPALAGSLGAPRAIDQALAARQKLADVQARINRQAPQAMAPSRGVPRVMATPAYIG